MNTSFDTRGCGGVTLEMTNWLGHANGTTHVPKSLGTLAKQACSIRCCLQPLGLNHFGMHIMDCIC
jgi:hypothetical protein